MPEQTVTAAERKRLFALMLSEAGATNRELKELAGFDLDKQTRERLVLLRLITVKLGPRRAWQHTLTEQGRDRCTAELSVPPTESRNPDAKLMQVMLNRLAPFLIANRHTLSDVFKPVPAVEVDVDQLIRKAYGELRPEPEAWIRLARLRNHLQDVVQADLDAALRRLNREPDVSIVAEDDQRNLTSEDRAAALRLGGDDKHLLMIEGS